ncbi:hypothetical protein EJ110_NYTH47865 [Nymphaea thermarum]|nr:hypothetical protein EJ110_NYTH47865 [Nymphaea thermarum]
MAELMGSPKDAGLNAGSASKAENVPIQVTSIRLTNDNYLSWSAALEIGITSRGRLSYITGDKPAPLKSDPQWATWALEDSQMEAMVRNENKMDSQMEGVTADARDHLFGQVYVRKEKATVEDVVEEDRTNPNPAISLDDPSPSNEELPIALRKGTSGIQVAANTTAMASNITYFNLKLNHKLEELNQLEPLFYNRFGGQI